MTIVTNFLMVLEIIVSMLVIVVVIALTSMSARIGIIFAVLSLVLGAMINQF